MKHFPKKHQKGFTLIETLFAILLFSASLVALMTVAGKGISATSTAQQQITAHYLAQEGLETARNVRDVNNVLKIAWDTGIDACVDSPCMVKYNTDSPPNAPELKPCQDCLVYKAFGAFVDNSANPKEESEFSREIKAIPVGSNGDEYKIVSTVRWKAKSIERKVSLVTILKKWQ